MEGFGCKEIRICIDKIVSKHKINIKGKKEKKRKKQAVITGLSKSPFFNFRRQKCLKGQEMYPNDTSICQSSQFQCEIVPCNP